MAACRFGSCVTVGVDPDLRDKWGVGLVNLGLTLPGEQGGAKVVREIKHPTG